jgi:hypothetical protein
MAAAAKRKASKTSVRTSTRAGRAAKAEQHLGATEDRVGDRTGSGAGYDLRVKGRKPRKGGVSNS